jgi:hypothetical protein
LTTLWYWILPDPPIGTPTSLWIGDAKKKLGGAPVLTVKLKSAVALTAPAVPFSLK